MSKIVEHLRQTTYCGVDHCENTQHVAADRIEELEVMCARLANALSWFHIGDCAGPWIDEAVKGTREAIANILADYTADKEINRD